MFDAIGVFNQIDGRLRAKDLASRKLNDACRGTMAAFTRTKETEGKQREHKKQIGRRKATENNSNDERQSSHYNSKAYLVDEPEGRNENTAPKGNENCKKDQQLKDRDDKMFKLLLAMKMYEVCDPIDLVMESLGDDISELEDRIELLGDPFDAAEGILMTIYGFTDTDLLKKIYSANYGEASEKELQTELNALGIDDLWAAKIAMEKEQAEIEKQLDDLRKETRTEVQK